MTKCEELQFDLPLYFDGSLSAEERMAVDAHLPECPLCRQKLSEFESLSLSFKAVPRLTAPEGLIASIRASVASELATSTVSSPVFRLIDRRRNWSDIWLVPSTVGTAATLIISFALLSFILTAPPVPLSARVQNSGSSQVPIFLASSDLTPGEYASSRLAIAGESPSINPKGALVALTKSLVRGEMRDDEVTVVADVFGNGLAEIAEVVEPSHDKHAVEELQRALGSDPSLAPFVPADVDQRSDKIRVVLKIQNVNVRTNLDRP
ncbi:MAG TPA: anti-sigma factor [Pyrinomonadaceae bacterium]|nr:anti-sigma factor [Pyrinomonadaceae bacterium]